MNLVVLAPSFTYAERGGDPHGCYHGLLRHFTSRGHKVTFLERDDRWSRNRRSGAEIPGIGVNVYSDARELEQNHTETIQEADAVMVGAGLPDGVAVGEWVLRHTRGLTVFHDTDTPGTLAELRQGTSRQISGEQIRRYQLYLASCSGPLLVELERAWHSPCARPLYCAIDAESCATGPRAPVWDLGYLGSYRPERQRAFERLLLRPAEQLANRSFIVAGDGYPADIVWPRNVERLAGLPREKQQMFYRRQRFVLHLTHVNASSPGWSPPFELLEAASSGTPVISDCWPGIDQFFTAGCEVLLATTGDDIMRVLRGMSEADARSIGEAARQRVLAQHTTAHRAGELESYLATALQSSQAGEKAGQSATSRIIRAAAA